MRRHIKDNIAENIRRAKMFRKKMIIVALSALAFTAGFAYCQEKAETRDVITVEGTVDRVDAVGNIIVVNANAGQISFSVPDDASITGGTKKIGLMEIQQGDPVTLQYYSPSPGTYVVVSITNNKNS
jgi:hypothetical protein